MSAIRNRSGRGRNRGTITASASRVARIRNRSMFTNRVLGAFAIVLSSFLTASCGSSATPATGAADDLSVPATVDPGTGAWEVVPRDRVLEECGLDPDLLDVADARLDRPWAVVRYGKLCHEYYPTGPDGPTRLFSATKTMAAAVTGMAVYETRDLERTGRKTGPLLDTDRVDHWLDEFTFNPESQIAHVLGMVGFNEDLSFGNKVHEYDGSGDREINRLSDVINTAIAQDPERLGTNLEEFWQRFMVQKLGMRDSTWSEGRPDKIFGFTWLGSVRDMARVGLLINNKGVWNGERLISEEWIYKMTHPSFEDANTSYGFLTWLDAKSNYHFGGRLGGVKFQNPLDACSPAAINATFPHGISAATDCYYEAPWKCDQEYDVGVWTANGLGGQLISGHAGLDMVLIVKELGQAFGGTLWGPVRPAVVARGFAIPGRRRGVLRRVRRGALRA